MYEWSEELKMIRDAVRQFVDNEIRPHREELEHGDLPPYDLLRKLYTTFGMDAMAARLLQAPHRGREGRGETQRASASERRRRVAAVG